MSWLDIAMDEERSTQDRVLAGLGCGLLPFICIAQEGQEAASKGIIETRDTAVAVAEQAGEAGLGVLRQVREEAEGPLESFEGILMWGSIAIGALIGLILVGLLVWFVALPLLGLGGPRKVVASG